MRPHQWLLAVALALSPSAALAKDFVEPSSKTSFEERPTALGTTFQCVGAGVRTYAWIKVYAIDFCLDASSARQQLDAYFAGPGRRLAALRGRDLARALEKAQDFFDYLAGIGVEKRAELVFLRSADADKVRAGFSKNLENALGSGAKAAIAEFASAIDRAVAVGDRAVFLTRPSGEVSLRCQGNTKTLKHEKAQWAFWSAYLGPDSVVPSLKESIARGVAELRP